MTRADQLDEAIKEGVQVVVEEKKSTVLDVIIQ